MKKKTRNKLVRFGNELLENYESRDARVKKCVTDADIENFIHTEKKRKKEIVPGKWYDINIILPEKHQICIVYDGEYVLFGEHRGGGEFEDIYSGQDIIYSIKDVTHWAKPPDPPIKKKCKHKHKVDLNSMIREEYCLDCETLIKKD
jgi:hypothetical protein